MRIVSFKVYLRKLLNGYLESHYNNAKPSLNLFVENNKDHRLMSLAQAYYLSINNIKLSDEIGKWTKVKFKSLEEYMNSDYKYALQYNEYITFQESRKAYLRREISAKMQEKAITRYAISKGLNIPQINLSNFFVKENDKVLSVEKLKEIYDFVSKA